ncbi:MAG: HYR domain-containing protein, partial [Saprospiraceae bacterium]
QIDSYSLSKSSFSCEDIGTVIPITLTITDIYGNTNFDTTNVYVRDTISPEIICANSLQVQLNNNGMSILQPTMLLVDASDSCGIASYFLSRDTLFCGDWPQVTIGLFVEDIHGNQGYCTTEITVFDTITPIASCTFHTAVLDNTGNVSVPSYLLNNNSIDNCPLTYTLSQNNFDCSHLGINNVTLFVNDNHGNIAQCNAQINVVDNEIPVANCFGNITLQLDNNGDATLTSQMLDSLSSDNCGAILDGVSKSQFGCIDLGSQAVTLFIKDDYGNTNNCQTIVTIEDNISPTAVAIPSITLQLDVNGEIGLGVQDVNNGSYDNCSISSITLSKYNFDCSDVGSTQIVTMIVTDVSGNTDSELITVTVEDNIPPSAVCASNLILPMGPSGVVFINHTMIDVGSSDSCGIATLTLDKLTFECADIPSNPNIVTMTVFDVNGNSATCTTSIVVEDTIHPTAQCALPYTLYLDSDGLASINVNSINNGSFDDCSGIDTMFLSQTVFDCNDIGQNTVFLTVEDFSNNVAVCQTTIDIQDVSDPLFIQFPTDTIVTNDIGNCGAVVSWVTPIFIDNCSIDTIYSTDTSGSFFSVGVNTIIYTLIDDLGNQLDTSFTITVLDTEYPIFNTCPQDIEVCEGDLVSWILPNVSDNCGIVFYDSTDAIGLFPVGLTTVTYTIKDAADNTVTCSFNVKVNPKVDLSSSTAEPTCFGIDDGEVNVYPSGGTPPFVIVWNTG